jgi:hypothetical protein
MNRLLQKETNFKMQISSRESNDHSDSQQNSPLSAKLERSLQHSHGLTTSPYPEPEDSSPQLPMPKYLTQEK